jgi:hypothetical protein
MNDDEKLQQRIVVALDALPVLPAPGLQWERGASRAFGGFVLAPLAIGAALLVVLLFAAQLVFPGARPASAPAEPGFRDDFSSGIDRTKWTSMIAGSGPTVAASDGRAELSIPANARAGADSRITASLSPQSCVARGDYVVSVDYELLDWPSLNGTDLLLHEVPLPNYAIDASISRFQNGDVESVMGHSQVNANTIPVSGNTGSLRLTRHGTNVIASYRVGNGPWQDVPVKIGSAGDATFRIGLLNDEFHFSGQAVRVAIDNFTLTATELTCA